MLNPIRLLRRLLELDRAFPALSDAEVAAEVERLYPWNFWTNLFDGANFWFGSTFISSPSSSASSPPIHARWA